MKKDRSNPTHNVHPPRGRFRHRVRQSGRAVSRRPGLARRKTARIATGNRTARRAFVQTKYSPEWFQDKRESPGTEIFRGRSARLSHKSLIEPGPRVSVGFVDISRRIEPKRRRTRQTSAIGGFPNKAVNDVVSWGQIALDWRLTDRAGQDGSSGQVLFEIEVVSRLGFSSPTRKKFPERINRTRPGGHSWVGYRADRWLDDRGG